MSLITFVLSFTASTKSFLSSLFPSIWMVHFYHSSPNLVVFSPLCVPNLSDQILLLILLTYVILVVVTRSLPRDRGMGKTIEPQKPGNSPGPRPEVVERQRVANERAAQRVRNWTVQNEMRGFLDRMTAGAT